jgi:hypothetical protein
MAMLTNGYTPLPCSCETKRPVLIGWPDAKVTTELINGWDIQFPKAQNHGLRLEALDLDISDQDICEDLESIVRDWFDGRGEILTRFGNPPRRLIPLHVTGDLTKTSRLFKDPAGKQQGLELLGTRSQFLAYGTHPKGYAYAWAHNRGPCNVPLADLPQVSAEEAGQLFQHLCEVLIERHGYADISNANGYDSANAETKADAFDADAALAAMQPNGASVEDTQRRVILSRLQHGDHPDDILNEIVSITMQMADTAKLGWSHDIEITEVKSRIIKQFETACKNHSGGLPWWLPAEFTERAQEILSHGHQLSLGFNRYGAYVRRHGQANRNLKAASLSDDETAAKSSSNDSGNGNERNRKNGGFVIKPFVPFDPAKLPPRQWLYGRHYLRRTVSATTAPGGFGKSSLDMVEAIAMATCRNLLDEQPSERLRVWLHNGEDNLHEMMRRVAGICQHYGIEQQELVGWFFMTSGNEVPLRVAQGYTNLDINRGLINRINVQIEENQIDVVTLDPLITLHGVPESDNPRWIA